MVIDKIITLANSKVRLRFQAMERSLRDCGCTLPLLVIPYDETRFKLPNNSSWWEMDEISDWLKTYDAHPTMRKYQCLTVENYQFTDADVIFLKNPEIALKDVTGFVTSCGHWNNPGHTYTSESLELLKKKSTLWQKFIFNTGQFACDSSLFSIKELKKKADECKSTCLVFPYHEQPGINLLVNTSGIPIHNLTLPPFNMESTWAGDYEEENFKARWHQSNQPYLIHWAGCDMNTYRPIDELFYFYLTREEKKEWEESLRKNKQLENSKSVLLQKLKKIYRVIKE